MATKPGLESKVHRNARVTYDTLKILDQLDWEEEQKKKQQERLNAQTASAAQDIARTFGDFLEERKASEQDYDRQRERATQFGPFEDWRERDTEFGLYPQNFRGNTPAIEAEYQRRNGANRAPNAYQTYMMQVMNSQPRQEETRSTDELRRDMNKQNRLANAAARMAADMGNQALNNQGLIFDPVYTSNLRTMGRTMEDQQQKAAAATNLYQTVSTQRRAEEEREKYASLMLNPDFAAKSQGDAKIADKGPASSYSEAELLYKNIFHRNDGYKEQGNASKTSAAQFVTDEEAATFFYLWNTQGAKAAKSYYDGYVANRAYERRANMAEAQAYNYGKYDPIGGSIARVGLNAVSGVGLVDMALQNLTRSLGLVDKNQPLNYYSNAQLPALEADALGKGAEDYLVQFAADELKRNLPGLKNPEKYAKVAGFLYQTGMSMADSSVAIALNLAGVPEPLTLAMMGAAAGTRAIRDARERGATDGQALAFGISSALMEAAFEKISLDKILEPSYATTAKAHFLNAWKQSFTEGSEEVMTTIANTVMDQLIMGDKSELFTRQRQLMEQGVSEKEALGAAFKQWGTEVLGDALGGLISGAGMGGIKEFGAGLRTVGQNYQAGLVQEDLNNFARAQRAERAQRDSYERNLQMQSGIQQAVADQNARELSEAQARREQERTTPPLPQQAAQEHGNKATTPPLPQNAQRAAETQQAARNEGELSIPTENNAKTDDVTSALRDVNPGLLEAMSEDKTISGAVDAVNAEVQNGTISAEAGAELLNQMWQAGKDDSSRLAYLKSIYESATGKLTKQALGAAQRIDARNSNDVQTLSESAPAEQRAPLTAGPANVNVNENVQEGNNGQKQTEAAAASEFRLRARENAAGREALGGGEWTTGVARLLEAARNTRTNRNLQQRADAAARLQDQAETRHLVRQSGQDLGIEDASDAKTVTVLDNDMLGREWEQMVSYYASKGVKLQAMIGQIETKDLRANGMPVTVRAWVSGDGKNIIVQADHPTLSWQQLLAHEELHRRIKENSAFKKAAQDALLEDKSLKPYLSQIIDRYTEAYRAVKPNITDDEVIEELLADYRAGFDMLDPLGTLAGVRKATKAAARDIRAVERKGLAPTGSSAEEQSRGSASIELGNNEEGGANDGRRNDLRRDASILEDVSEKAEEKGQTVDFGRRSTTGSKSFFRGAREIGSFSEEERRNIDPQIDNLINVSNLANREISDYDHESAREALYELLRVDTSFVEKLWNEGAKVREAFSGLANAVAETGEGRTGELKEIRKQYDNQQFRDRYSKAAEDYFKTTTDFDQAGYIDTLGNLLNFNKANWNKKDIKTDSEKWRDHQDIYEVLDFLHGVVGKQAGMHEFVNMGNIRVAENGIEINQKPTKEQRSALWDYAEQNPDGLTVDFVDENGSSIGDIPYETVKPQKLLADIDAYFKTGKVPEQSTTAQFHGNYSTEIEAPYNRTALLSEETVDRWLKDYASQSSPKYAQAYITRMSPDQFLKLTTSRTGRLTISSQTGPMDAEQLIKSTQEQPLQLIIRDGEVVGHEGRHRVTALSRANVQSIPVLVFDSSNKYSKTDVPEMVLQGQDFGSSRSYDRVTLENLTPLSYENRDRIVQEYGKQDAFERSAEKLGYRQTMKFSAEIDADYMAAVERGDTETAQRMVEEAAKAAGFEIHAYHGTGRADRVGNVFRADRATSGPMAFFTDSKEIAENYSKDKRDTSLAYDADYDSYETQFRAKHTKTGKDFAIYKLWGYIPMSERAKIKEKARHVRIDWEGEGDVIYDPQAMEASGGWSHQLQEFKGDVLKALNEQWLNSGNLFNEEENYLKVLELAGVNDALRKAGFEMPRYMNPDYREEAVYDVLLKIQKPFDTTSMIDEDFIQGFEDYAADNEGRFQKESLGADFWDKNSVSADDFAERMRDDLERGVTHAWTSIPDVMSEYLKSLGYDGIKDAGGKNGGQDHTVWIPFSSEQIKRADPVTYDDNGNVIPLSERFNTEKNDIRYSIEIDPDVSKQFSEEGIEERQVQSLLRENEELKKKLKNAKAQIKASDRTQPREEDVRRMAKDILKAYSSKAEGVDESLRELAHTIMSNDTRWTDVRDQAVRLAGKILDNSSVLVGDDAELNREIRNAIRKEKIAYTNNGNIADYGQWRKDNFGKLKIAKDGIPVETRWDELQDTYGKGYFPDDIKNPADQIVYLSELFDRLQDVYENPYNQNMAEATEFLANDIIDRVISGEMRQAPTTYADRAETRLARETLRGELRVQKVKERLEAERERRNEKIAELKEHYKDKEAKGNENRKARDMRAKIINHAKQMTTELLKPTDKKHVPESLRQSVAAVLSAIDLGSGYDVTAGQDGKTIRVGRGTEGAEQTKRTKAFMELRESLLKEADGLVLDPELLGTVEEPGSLTRLVTELADVPIANMNTEQLQVVYDALRGIEGAVKSANRMLSSARWAAVGEAADAIRSENSSKQAPLQLAGAAGRAQDLTRLDMLTPEGYFHRLGKSGQTVFKMLRGAQDKFITNMTKATNDTRKIVGDTDVGALEKEKHTVTMGGEETTMTTAQIMELYCLMQRDQGLQHITTGGIMVEPVRQGIKQTTQAEPLHPSMEELLDAVRLLTPEEIRLADAMQDYLSKDMAELGNEATLAVYGYKKFGQESKYWKIRSNKNEIQQSIEKETQTTSVANRGFTKAVNPQANTSVKIGSIFDTYSQSVNDMATYAAWLAVGEDVNRIRNYVFRDSEGQRTGTVKGVLDRVIGSGGANYLQRLLADIANGAGMDDAGLTSGFVGAYKAAAIGANIRVIIQQPTAILRAAEMIDPKYLAVGLKNPMKAFERAKEYSPIAQWKDWGYFDINTGRKMKDVLFESSSKLEKVRQVSMAMAGKADSFAWGQLWGAVEAETKAKTDLKPGTRDFYEACAERFNDIIDHTQVVDGILQRSQIMRSKNAITRMAVSFMSEPTKQYNQFMSAVYDYRHTGDKKQAKQMLARTTFSMLAAGVMNVLAQSIVDALRNDDRERKYWEKLLQSFLGYNPDDDTFGEKFKTFAFSNMGELVNPATYLPYAKDIMSIIQGYSVDRMDMDGISDTITAITRLAKALNGEGKQTVGYTLGKAIEQGAKLLGLSAYNVDRDLTALFSTIANDADMPVLQYYLNRYRYRPGDNLSKELKGILWDARQKNDGSYDIIIEHLLKDGYTQEQIDKAVMDRLSDESGFTEARKAADAAGNDNGSYDLSETLEALENATLSEEDRNVLLEAKLSDKQYGNYTTLLQYSDYDTWLSVMREMPANLSQAKIEAVLDKRDDLTTKQKAAYWQVLSGSKSTKNNPYSQEVGAEILNAKAEMQPDKEPERVAQMRTTLSGLGLQDSKVDALAPILGGDGSNTSKWRAVANQNLGKDQQDEVLKSIMTDSMYRNWAIASGENISLDSYVKGREAYVDLDNSGTDQNSEWTAALEKVSFDKDATRNNYIKGVLWQIYTGSTSTKNNPFDKTGGQTVIDAKGKGGGKGTGSNAPARIPTLRLPDTPKAEKPSSGLRIRAAAPAQAPRSGLRIMAK